MASAKLYQLLSTEQIATIAASTKIAVKRWVRGDDATALLRTKWTCHPQPPEAA